MASFDGYAKFFNEHPRSGVGSPVFAGMNTFEQIVNQVYHIVQTSWTQQTPEYSFQVPAVTEQPITMTSYPHLFVIRISWTATTIIGLVLALLIALNSWALAGRWIWATYRLGFGEETWNLLRPVELMAYSLAASQELIHSLDTKEHRRMEMRGKTKVVLRERPSERLSLLTGKTLQRTGSGWSASTPGADATGKTADEETPGVSVHERPTDVEHGSPGT